MARGGGGGGGKGRGDWDGSESVEWSDGVLNLEGRWLGWPPGLGRFHVITRSFWLPFLRAARKQKQLARFGHGSLHEAERRPVEAASAVAYYSSWSGGDW